MIDLEYVRERLPGRLIHWHASIGSTMTEAAKSYPHGTVIGAEEQTAGIGRYGRHWHSEPQAGIYMSVVLRLPFSMETLPLVTLALGLAVSESIQKVTGVAVDLRWPNDVLIGNKKVCGILTQWEPPSIIAGIGINVNNTEFPPELQATSLRIASGRQHAREQIIAELLPAIDTYCGILETEGKEPILRAFTQASTYVTGRKVKIEETALVGTTDGLTNTGFLLIRDDQGKQHQIIAGGVRPC